jgi:hypothetical protein
MTHRIPNNSDKHTSMQSYRQIQEIGTICVKDTCLQIPLAAAQALQSGCLGNSLAARSLRDD